MIRINMLSIISESFAAIIILITIMALSVIVYLFMEDELVNEPEDDEGSDDSDDSLPSL